MFNHLLNRFLHTKDGLKVHLKRPIIVPAKLISTSYATYDGGVYDNNCNYVQESSSKAFNRYYLRGKKLIKEFKDLVYLEGRSLYIGMCHRHFGHFLIETVARLGLLNLNELDEYDNIVLLCHENEIPQFVREFFELFGLTSKVIFITKATKCENLTVLSQIIFYPKDVSKYVSEVAGVLREGDSKVGGENLVYLSRLNLKPGRERVIIGENYIEDILSGSGFKCIHPESLSLKEQIDVLEKASVVVGNAGSAFHTNILTKNINHNIYYGSRKHPKLFSRIDRILGNKSDAIEARLDYSIGMATGYRYGFSPEIVNPELVLNKLKSKGLVSNTGFKLTDKICRDLIEKYNSSLLLRALFVEEQFKSFEYCDSLKNEFLKLYPVNWGIIHKSMHETSVFVKYFEAMAKA